MAQDVVAEIEIDRPRAEVADYATDPDNAPSWYQNIKRVEWKSPKPLRLGSEVAFEAEFMDQALEYTYEITEYEPGERVVMKTAAGPFDMQTIYVFSDTPGSGTKMELHNRAHSPEMATDIERETRKDLARLKAILEGVAS
jgi:uncharacterized protein YndB with AHSA1/START domain